MTLSVIGRESLDELERLTRRHFSRVVNKDVRAPVFEECSDVFMPLDPKELGSQVRSLFSSPSLSSKPRPLRIDSLPSSLPLYTCVCKHTLGQRDRTADRFRWRNGQIEGLIDIPRLRGSAGTQQRAHWFQRVFCGYLGKTNLQKDCLTTLHAQKKQIVAICLVLLTPSSSRSTCALSCLSLSSSRLTTPSTLADVSCRMAYTRALACIPTHVHIHV